MSVLEVEGSTTADGTAVTVAGESLSRAQLFAAAAVVADRVAGAQIVALDADASVRTIVAVVGCLLAGVTAVPVAPDSGARERRHILTDSGAQLWLGSPREDVALECVPVEAPSSSSSSSSSSWTEPADGTALVLYTSGTTGAPKGVPLTRAAIAAGLDGLREAWAWSPEDVLVHGLPLFHVHGLVLGVLGALRAGSPLVHTGRPTPAAYAAARGSLYFGVPTVWGRVAADPASARALRPARLLVSGSAALPAPVFRELATLAGQGPIERYGMTETLITLASRVNAERRPGWVGGPIPGVQARVIDDAGAPVAADGETIGELQVRGVTVFSGYLGRRADAAFTADGWFRTGDAAVVDARGDHQIIGRAKDDLIKTGGYRIGAGEIESCLLEHPSVFEAAVVGVPDADLGQRVVAYVVGTGINVQELITHVAGELSVHKRPREVRVVEALPRTALGKVQKSQLG